MEWIEIFKESYPRRMLITSILAIIGVILFFYTGGTWLEAFFIYLPFHFVPIFMTLAVHRWITHKQFEPYKPAKYFLLWSVVTAGVMTPIEFGWSHRVHHKTYNDPDDTQDPIANSLGFWKLYFAVFNVPKGVRVPLKDIVKQKDVMFVEKNFTLLRILNFGLFWMIDPHVAMLSLLFGSVFSMAHSAIFHGALHNGLWAKEYYPVNLHPLWQIFNWEVYHIEHHDHQSEPNFGKYIGKFDIGYYVMKILGTVRESK